MMKGETISAVLPIRAGSQRVLNKNTRPFGPYPFGLTELKIKQLLRVKALDEIVVDTDVPEITDILDRLKGAGEDVSSIRVERRDPKFAGSSTSTDDLIKHIAPKIKTKHVLWTHTTQPFADDRVLTKAIDLYVESLNSGFDSLMSVTSLKTFIWDQSGPVNYSRKAEKWPRTQTLPEWYIVNSAVFITNVDTMKIIGDRIGEKPYYYVLDHFQGLDIDEERDFLFAESIARSRTT
ncbi:MAG: acylneuraminate cytidylyltransferase family protein [Elusimicrobia bacterium]|nr:acylneuraminate cytidylyltransferase family protein [Elusimicrobiota bacterium]